MLDFRFSLTCKICLIDCFDRNGFCVCWLIWWFCCRCDKNGDGILSEDEVREVIVLSASENKLSNLKQNAATYASLIMEKMDPDHKGYIEVGWLVG